MIKNLIILSSVLLIMTAIPVISYADEIKMTEQKITNEQGYAVINLEKSPAADNRQSIKNTKSWFCINVILNGKVKDNANRGN